MMRPLFDIATLRDELEDGALVLTPNNRLASKIRHAWGCHQQLRGLRSWPRPNVEAIDTWLDEQWLRCCDLGVMSAAAGTPTGVEMELLLWERAIDKDPEKPDLLLPTSFARQARSAYDIAQRWQIPDHELQRESPMLWRWIEHYRQQQRQHRLISAADRTEIVRQAFGEGLLAPEPTISLYGFDSLSPLYREVLKSASQQLIDHPPAKSGGGARVLGCFDERRELNTAVDWAVARHRADPQTRIGIIIPELPRLRSQVERLLRDRLQPGYNQPGEPRHPLPFNLSAGIPLAGTALTDSALLLLSLNREQLPLTDFCRILNSPFWGEQSVQARAQIETRLRERAEPAPRCSEFRYQVSRCEAIMGGNLSGRLEASTALSRNLPKRARYSQWLQCFREQLQVLGWPGERGLDSVEYQQLQHWHGVFEQYQQFDQLGHSVELSEALRQLRQLAGNTTFQPETPDASIQVLGLLEGIGLHFDHLWVMGMDNRRWPQPVAPNPLLPIPLQRQLGTPRSDPEQELKLARRQFERLLQAAPDVIFSYPHYEGDQPLEATELIRQLPTLDPAELPTSSTLTLDRINLETVNCERAPALDLQREAIGGGTGIFKNQAGCPFNAFAIHRLGARQMPEPSLGLSPLERGNLVHDCLERLWERLQDLKQLLELGDDERRKLALDIAAAALSHWQKLRPSLFGPGFTRIEQERLANLMQLWLALESARAPFRVTGLEQRLEAQFAGLPLRMTIDRVDELETGQRVIIDYKTGSAAVGRWLGQRLEEPQLPLYLLCNEAPVAAICFAQINAGEQRFLGFGKSAGLLPGVRPPGNRANEPESWDTLVDQWRQSLAEIAGEFKRGDAAVQFHHSAARQYQQYLEPLNRAAELPTAQTGGEDNP